MCALEPPHPTPHLLQAEFGLPDTGIGELKALLRITHVHPAPALQEQPRRRPNHEPRQHLENDLWYGARRGRCKRKIPRQRVLASANGGCRNLLAVRCPRLRPPRSLALCARFPVICSVSCFSSFRYTALFPSGPASGAPISTRYRQEHGKQQDPCQFVSPSEIRTAYLEDFCFCVPHGEAENRLG